MWAKLLIKGVKLGLQHHAGNRKVDALLAKDVPRCRVMASYIGGGLDTSGGVLVVTETMLHFQSSMGSSIFRTNELHVPLTAILGIEVKDHGFPWKRRCRLEVLTPEKTHVFIVNKPDDIAAMLRP